MSLTNWSGNFRCIFHRVDNSCTRNSRSRSGRNTPRDTADGTLVSLPAGSVGQSNNNHQGNANILRSIYLDKKRFRAYRVRAIANSFNIYCFRRIVPARISDITKLSRITFHVETTLLVSVIFDKVLARRYNQVPIYGIREAKSGILLDAYTAPGYLH